MMKKSTLTRCALSVLGLLAGCTSSPPVKPSSQVSKPATTTPAARPGAYYLDDGPGDNPPADLLAIADAVPRAEPLHRFANRPYQALGIAFTPITDIGDYQKEGVASWYGRRYHGKPTASGEVYDMYGMSAAHPTLPIPSYARVTALDNGKSVVVRINDRGPFLNDRIIDLSYVAAFKLDVAGKGSGRVRVESLNAEGVNLKAPAAIKNPTIAPIASDVVGERGYFVQLGAFGQPDNAEKFLQRARAALGIAPQLSRTMQIGALHRVSLGPFASEDEAGNWADKTRSILGIEAIKISR